MHLVSAGGQHHLISQPAHVALIQAVAPTPGPTPVSVLPSSTPSTTPAPTGLSLPLAANQGEASGLPTYLALAGLGPSRHALGYCLSSLPPVLFSLASNSDICLLPSPALGLLPSFGFLVSFLPSPQCSFLLQCHQPWWIIQAWWRL